jgi:hypothetical protein
VDHLWTFGKRGKFESLDELWSRWKEFCRLMGKRHGDRWQYLAVPELHEDGETWHLHVGLRGFWDVNQLRLYWHRALVPGAKAILRGADAPGNVDAKRFRGRSARAIAGYVAKYIGKGMGAVQVGRKLYSSSEGLRPLEKLTFHFISELGEGEMWQSVTQLLSRLSGVPDWDSKCLGEGVAACWMFEESWVPRGTKQPLTQQQT